MAHYLVPHHSQLLICDDNCNYPSDNRWEWAGVCSIEIFGKTYTAWEKRFSFKDWTYNDLKNAISKISGYRILNDKEMIDYWNLRNPGHTYPEVDCYPAKNNQSRWYVLRHIIRARLQLNRIICSSCHRQFNNRRRIKHDFNFWYTELAYQKWAYAILDNDGIDQFIKQFARFTSETVQVGLYCSDECLTSHLERAKVSWLELYDQLQKVANMKLQMKAIKSFLKNGNPDVFQSLPPGYKPAANLQH